MKRQVFFSFHFDNDFWRSSQVRNMGIVDGNKPVSDNKWEEIKSQGDQAIKRWIHDQLENRSCTIVLVGSETANRKWIQYEIEKSWESGMGVMGIRIHNLKDQDGNQGNRGPNPFQYFEIGEENLSNIVDLHSAPYTSSDQTYNYIQENIEDWVEDAVGIRNEYTT